MGDPTARPIGPERLTCDGFPARHAFFTRRGGVSTGPYDSLNLGHGTGDDAAAVDENRRRVTTAFGGDPDRWVGVRQVHGAEVIEAPAAGHGVAADAIVATGSGWTLRVSIADCVPVLLVAHEHGFAAAIHAGWRGAVAGVVDATIEVARTRFGVPPGDLHAAIGPCISRSRYQVGREVVAAFARAGFPADIWTDDDEADGRARLSVADAVRFALARNGVDPERVHGGTWCTSSDPQRFYSHRRDGGVTGRHWAVVATPD